MGQNFKFVFMSNLNLSSLKCGFQARVVEVQNSYENKHLKQLINMGIVKGNVVEIIDNIGDLMLLKNHNVVMGVSRELADNVKVRIV